MSSKKKNNKVSSPNTSGGKKPSTGKNSAPAKKNNVGLIIGLAVAAVVVVGLFIAGGGGADKASALTPTPEEAKYLGRYLPAGYEEPNVGKVGVVSSDTKMVPIAASQTASSTTIPVSELTSKRVVGFTYTKADGTPIALISYVKPSGKVVVAVSYCVPCQGTSHTLTTDGALTCDSCGTKRDAETGVGLSGACKLYPLDEMPATVQGDRIVIDNAALDGWQQQPTDRKVG